MSVFRHVAAATLALCATSALASEIINYTYDPRGRLVTVARSGTINDGIQASYTYDKADNRTNVTVTGPSFSVNDVSATEGSPLTFTVSRTLTTSAMSVSYATSNGTAIAGSDYTATSGTLNFAIGEASKPVSVPTIDDAAVESAETVILTLSNPVGAVILDGTGLGTINDNDVPPPCSGVTFTISSNGAVTEGANSLFTVTKSGTATGSCSVNYATANGTAIAGSDYTAASGTLTFTTAQASQTISIATTDDAIIESAETFSVALSSPTGGSAVGTPGSANATLNDNDSGPCSGISYSVNDVTVVEGSPLIFTVSKAGTTASSCTVNYATANGTATAPTHYIATSGTLTFTSTQTSRTVTVTTIDNSRLNATLSMYLNLSAPSGGATLSDSQGLGRIQASGGGGGCKTCLQSTGEQSLDSSDPASPPEDSAAPPPPPPE